MWVRIPPRACYDGGMTSRDFCFWLQGFFELSKATTLDAKQTDLVRRHLALVFKHEIDPAMGDAQHQADLNQTHQIDNRIEEVGYGPGTSTLAPQPPSVIHVEKPLIRC